MKKIGTIVDFAPDGKAVVEFEEEIAPGGAGSGEEAGARQMALEVIPGIAKGTQVYVEVAEGSLLRMPALAWVMLGAFAAGAAVSLLALAVMASAAKAVLPSVLAGLVCAGGAIVVINAKERRRARGEFRPRIIGVVWPGGRARQER